MLTWIREAFNISSKVLPMQYMFGRKFNSHIYDFHIRNIFRELNDRFDVSTCFNLTDIYQCPPFRGLISELFRANDFYPTPKDIAIAANISVLGYCNEKETYNDAVIDFSYSFIKKLRQRIVIDPRLEKLFSQLGKDPQKVCSNFDRADIEKTLQSKKKTFIHYFKSFEDKHFNYQITIWHQAAEKTWVEWKPQDSITLNIDPGNIREGFFLMGFDYSNNERNLTYATRVNGYEYFDSPKNDMSDIDRAIWLR